MSILAVLGITFLVSIAVGIGIIIGIWIGENKNGR